MIALNLNKIKFFLLSIVSILFFLSSEASAGAEVVTSTPFSYRESFEDKADPVRFWASDGNYTVNYKGLSLDKAADGEKSFKIDVTFNNCTFCYWMIPVNVIADGRLNFTGSISIGESNMGRIGIGGVAYFKPTMLTNNLPPFLVVDNNSTNNEWKIVEKDLVSFGKEAADVAIQKHVWGATGSNVGRHLQGILVMLWGKPGQRVVAYIDDIKIQGDIPVDKSYKAESNNRWSSAQKIFSDKIASWQDNLTRIDSRLTLAKGSNSSQEISEKLLKLKEEIGKIAQRGFIYKSERERIDNTLLADFNDTELSGLMPADRGIAVLDYATYTLEENTGNNAFFDEASLSFRLDTGNVSRWGYCFTGMKAIVPDEIELKLITVDNYQQQDINSFAGFVIDFHTSQGYKKRIYLGLGVVGKDRELQYPYWIKAEDVECQFVNIDKASFSKTGNLRIDLKQYAPLGWDGEVWLGTGLMNVGKNKRLYVALADRKDVGTFNNDYWSLENSFVRFTITKRNGNLEGGLNLAKGNDKCIVASVDEYAMEAKEQAEVYKSSEVDDIFEGIVSQQLQANDNPKRLILKYKNAVMGIRVLKTYELYTSDRKLIKKIEISAAENNTDGLLKYASGLNLNQNFRSGGYYHHLCEGGWTTGSRIKQAKEVTSLKSMGSNGGISQICFVNPDKGYGVGHYKYTVNGNYDLIKSMVESYYTSRGWIIGITGDFIGLNKKLTAEVHYTVFQGDQIAFHREYMALPAYRAINNYSSPGWLKDVRFISGWSTSHGIGSNIPCKDFLANFDQDEPIMGWPISPWGDTTWERRGDFLDGEIETYPFSMGEINTLKRVQAVCPRMKIGNYTWHYSLGPKSKLLKEHPEWLTYDKDDNPLLFNDGGPRTCVRVNIKRPEYVDHSMDKVQEVVKALGYDVYYIDEINPRGHSYVDWRTRTVIHNYDWINYWNRLRNAVRDCGQDKIFYANAYLPLTTGYDCGILELGSIQWISDGDVDGPNSWRSIADRVFFAKLYQYDESRWIAPLFWGHAAIKTIRNNDPYCSNYLIAFGLKPSSPGEADYQAMGSAWYSLKSKMPYINAAYEMRGVKIVDADISPCWWKVDTEIEAYTLKQGNASFIPIINHNGNTEKITVSANTRGLGLDPNRETYMWLFNLKDPWEIKVEDVRDSAWDSTPIMSTSFLGKRDELDRRVSLTVKVRPRLLSLAMLTQTPALIYSVNNRISQILLPSTLDIDIQGNIDRKKKTVSLEISSRKETAEILIYYPQEWGKANVLMDGISVDYTECNQFSNRFLKIGTNAGEHKVKVLNTQR